MAPLGTLGKICLHCGPSGNWWGGGERRPTDRQQGCGLSALSVSPDPRVGASTGYCSVLNWRAGESCLALWIYGPVIVRGESPEQSLLLILHMCLVQQHSLRAVPLWKSEGC